MTLALRAMAPAVALLKHPLRVFSTLGGSECEVTLYHVNNKIEDPKWFDMAKISFSRQTASSRQTAKKASDLVACYFGVRQEWDKRLLETVFLGDIQLNWFEFIRVGSPDICLGVQIAGDRSVVFNENPQESYVPMKKFDKLSATVQTAFGDNQYELDYAKMRAESKRDLLAIALFNSTTFKVVRSCSTNMFFARTLEKFEMPVFKKG